MIKLRRNSTITVVGHDADADRDRRWSLWVARMAKGDLDALSFLYDESSTVIFTLVREILHDHEAAEDTLVKIYDHARATAATFDARRQTPLDWLIALARKFSIERLRLNSPPISSSAIRDMFKHKRCLANIALAVLSEEQRSILEMTYLGGLTPAEVGDLLSVSPQYVTQQIVQAIRKMRMNSPNLGEVTIRVSNFG